MEENGLIIDELLVELLDFITLCKVKNIIENLIKLGRFDTLEVELMEYIGEHEDSNDVLKDRVISIIIKHVNEVLTDLNIRLSDGVHTISVYDILLTTITELKHYNEITTQQAYDLVSCEDEDMFSELAFALVCELYNEINYVDILDVVDRVPEETIEEIESLLAEIIEDRILDTIDVTDTSEWANTHTVTNISVGGEIANPVEDLSNLVVHLVNIDAKEELIVKELTVFMLMCKHIESREYFLDSEVSDIIAVLDFEDEVNKRIIQTVKEELMKLKDSNA